MIVDKNQPMAKFLNIDFLKTKWREHLDGKNNGAVNWKYFYLTKWYLLFFE